VFRVGQSIMFVEHELSYNDTDLFLSVGQIVYIGDGELRSSSARNYLIEFNKYIGGHSGDNRGENGHCWWCNIKDLRPYSDYNQKDFKAEIRRK